MNTHLARLIGLIIFSICGTLLFFGAIYFFAFKYEGDLYEKLTRVEDIESFYLTQKETLEHADGMARIAKKDFTFDGRSLRCSDQSTGDDCLDPKIRSSASFLVLFDKKNRLAKEITYFKESVGAFTWLTLDSRSQFDRHRKIGIVFTEKANQLQEAGYENFIQDQAQFQSIVDRIPADDTYYFYPLSETRHLFYQYIPY